MPNAHDIRTFFDAIAPRYDRVYARTRDDTKRRMTELIERLGAGPRDVLDLGVGTGTELPYLLDAGHRVTGVDVSEAMLALCNKRSRRIPCVRADFWEGLPFPDASFDAVVALFGALAHPPSEESYPRLLAEVARVLREEGSLFAEMPSAAWRESHPMFTDAASGASIEIVAPSAEAWRAWLEPHFRTTITQDASELRIVASRRSS